MGLFDHMNDDRRRQLFGVLLLFIGLLLAVSLASHVYFALSDDLGSEIWTTELGVQNRQISNWLFTLLGVCAWLVPLLLILWGWNRIADNDPEPLALKSVFLTAVSIIIVALIYVVGGHRTAGVSGLLGAFLSDLGTRHIGKVGTFLAGVGGVVLITLLTTEFDLDAITQPFIAIGERLAEWGSSAWETILSWFERSEEPPARSRKPQARKTRKEKPTAPKKPALGRRKKAEPDAAAESPLVRTAARKPAPTKIVQETRPTRPRPAGRKTTQRAGAFRLPPLSILDEPVVASTKVSREELLARSRLLEEKLADFGVEARVDQVQPGPVITRFEMEPARGVKVSQIANLQDDLALAMKATAIRIVAPIPGRGAVGIEIPNEHPEIVYLKDILSADVFQNMKSEIPLALGKDTTGRIYCADLAKMPHLLVAGATGAGKSICLNAILSGIMFRSTPDEARFLMIDPKRLELPRYEGIPHLIAPVVTDAKPAAMALQWLVGEMDRRYDILSALTVRDIYGFNRRVADGSGVDALHPDDRHKLPHIVVVVDEFADLMVRAPREVEAPVQRLAQMARAVGIHLVFATQRPSVDVITGVIKANFASRVAFRVISMTDSRTILDRNGAETLLGNGDMLFLPTGKPEPIRLHGAFISNEETARLVGFLRKQGEPDYQFDLGDDKRMAVLAASKQDELYDEAVNVVVGTQMGSTSLLQRRLSVGYARAGRLMDLLEANGIVGPFKGSKARDVLVSAEYIEELRRGATAPVEAAAVDPFPEPEPDEPQFEEEEEYEEAADDEEDYEDEDAEEEEAEDEEEYEEEEEEEAGEEDADEEEEEDEDGEEEYERDG